MTMDKSASSATAAAAAPSPGWYDDGTGRQRWWDGASWTNHYAPEPPRPKAQTGGGVMAGWVFAWLMPIVGLLIGIALIAAGNREGGKITATSVAMGLAWYVLISIMAGPDYGY